MQTRSLLSLIVCSILLTVPAARGAAIPGLYNTGVNNSGAVLADNTADPHYVLLFNPDNAVSTTAIVQDSTAFPIVGGPWLANSSTSKWIGPRFETSGAAAGEYTYRLTFDLGGLDPASAIVTGQWSSDNAGVGILLNGVATGITFDGNFAVFSPTWILTNGFIAGMNTMDFVVTNAGLGYTGLRAEVAGTALPSGSPPVISGQPQSQTVAGGVGVAFSVLAQASPAPRYQWRKNGANLAGQNGGSLVFPAVSAADEGRYDVVVTNSVGSVTSVVATLTVGLAMVNASFEVDNFATYPGYVSGNGPITGWTALGNHGINPAGGTSPFADNGAIPQGAKVAFMQADGALSQVVSNLTVGNRYYVQYHENARTGGTPAVEVQMGGATILAPHLISPVGGSSPYRRVITGVFTASASSMPLSFIKSNPAGGDTTALIDNVVVLPVGSNSVPIISLEPQDQSVESGSQVTFVAQAVGGLPLRFQWLRGSTPISGATGTSYTLAVVSKVDEGNYSVVVTNEYGSVASRQARLTVTQPLFDLYNTGVDASRVVLPDNGVDSHFAFAANPDNAGVTSPIVQDGTVFPIVPGTWLVNSATSKWIGPRFNTVEAAAGNYTYKFTFDLSQRDLSTVVIRGGWATDNAGTSISVNGIPTGLQNTIQFNAWTLFTLSTNNATFLPGTNVIEFTVNNASAGYTGLRVEFLSSDASFLPGTLPFITRQPSPATSKLAEGDSLTLSASVAGSAPFSYQWLKDGAPLTGQTAASLTLSSVTVAQSGAYSLAVSNSAGGVVSQPASVCVCYTLVPEIFGTGVGPTGALLSAGTADPHYTFRGPDLNFPGPEAYVAFDSRYPIPPWLANGPFSKWITPNASADAATNTLAVEGTYTYETLIDLVTVDLSQFRLVGAWGMDNTGPDILVNGISTGIANTSGFGGLVPFEITTGLIQGLNSIEFVVNNGTSTGPNPTGLRVDLRGLLNLRPQARIERVGGEFRLRWSPANPCQKLQCADAVTGPWTDCANQSNPQPLTPSGVKFYRIYTP
jgi:hypothetical protein